MNRIEGTPHLTQRGMSTAARRSPGFMKPLYGVPLTEEVLREVEYKCNPATVNLDSSLWIFLRAMPYLIVLI